MNDNPKDDLITAFQNALLGITNGPPPVVPKYGAPIPLEYKDYHQARWVDIYAPEDNDGTWSIMTTAGIRIGAKREIEEYAHASFEITKKLPATKKNLY